MRRQTPANPELSGSISAVASQLCELAKVGEEEVTMVRDTLEIETANREESRLNREAANQQFRLTMNRIQDSLPMATNEKNKMFTFTQPTIQAARILGSFIWWVRVYALRDKVDQDYYISAQVLQRDRHSYIPMYAVGSRLVKSTVMSGDWQKELLMIPAIQDLSLIHI